MGTSMVAKESGKRIMRKVPFVVKAEGAREVIVTGDFTGWATDGIRLSRREDGQWRATLQLPQGEYQYRLLIDGEWRDDPSATRRIPNAFASENCILLVK